MKIIVLIAPASCCLVYGGWVIDGGGLLGVTAPTLVLCAPLSTMRKLEANDSAAEAFCTG